MLTKLIKKIKHRYALLMFKPEIRLIRIESQEVSCSIEDLFGSSVYSNLRSWPEMKWLEKHRKDIHSGYILDVGANQGITSIYYAKLFPGCFVQAIEPNPYNVSLIAKNIRINNTNNVGILPYAASSHSSGQICISTHSNASISDSGILVPMVALDNISMDRVSFVKVDIEGAELDALRGLSQHLLRSRPLLDIEVHLFTAENKRGFLSEILDILEPVKYTFSVVDGYQGNINEDLTSIEVLQFSDRPLINLLARPV